MKWRFGGRYSPGHQPELADQVLDHLEDGVVVPEGGVVSWLNPAATLMFPGVADAAGRPLLEMVREHRINALAAKALQRGQEEAAEVGLSISNRTLYVRAVPLNAGGLLLLFRDLTRFRHLETVRQQFVANLAHEMRTPLAGLDLAAQTLAGELPAQGDARVFLDRLFQESQRLQAMVNNLSQLAALDDEGVQVDRAAFDVAALLEDLVQRNLGRASRQGLGLRTELANGGAALQAWGDRAKTDQALQNLVDNALKFTTAGELVITAHGGETRVEIAIRDTGPGIPSSDLPRIFERFYKVDRSRGGHAGSGLGLSIARHLIELQGGTILAESTPNVGTEMRVRLPRGPLTSS